MRLTRECFMDRVKVKSKVMNVGRKAGKKGKLSYNSGYKHLSEPLGELVQR